MSPAEGSAGDSDRDARGLERFLAETWGTAVRVEGLRAASAGARRRNLLFDAHRGGERVPLCATVSPSDEMQHSSVAAETAALRFAEAAGVPAPHVHALCDDPSYLGGAFFVTTRVEGESIPRRVLRTVEAHPGLGARLARQCGAAMARLHQAPLAEAPALPGPSGEPPTRYALTLTKLALAELLQPSPALRLVVHWLERNEPSVSPECVVHSDFRNGNIIVGPEGLRAALDWEVCRRGDPMEDPSWMCVRMWRFRNDALEVGGFGHRDDLRAGYEEAGGQWDEERFHWWKVLGTVSWGLGLATQAKEHLDGTLRSIVLAASGRRVAELEYDALMLLRGHLEP